jgi:aspartate racemase
MGPAATVELYARLTAAVEAATDQEHPRILIDSQGRVPDRTLALTAGGEDPVPYLLDSVRRLTEAGASLLIMPCNTAHAYLGTLTAATDVPLVDMVGETLDELARRATGGTGAAGEGGPVALLATDGTVRVGLYQRAAEERGIPMLVPDDHAQRMLMDAIGRVKAGDLDGAAAPFHAAVTAVAADGATSVLLGCTELSVLAVRSPAVLPAVDPLDVLVRTTLDRLGVPRRA